MNEIDLETASLVAQHGVLKPVCYTYSAACINVLLNSTSKLVWLFKGFHLPLVLWGITNCKLHHQSVCWPGPGTRQGSFITIKRNPRHALQRQSPGAVHSCILAWMYALYNNLRHLVCGPITSPVLVCVLTRVRHGAGELTSGCLMTFIFVISYYPRLCYLKVVKQLYILVWCTHT